MPMVESSTPCIPAGGNTVRPGIAAPAGREKSRSGPVVAVLLPSVFSVRNVVHSGVLRRLSECGAAVHLLFRRVPETWPAHMKDEIAFAAGVHAMEWPPATPVRGKAFVDGVIKSGFSRRNRITSHAIYRKWHGRSYGPRDRLQSMVTESLGAVASSRPVLQLLSRKSEQFHRRTRDLDPVRQHLERLNPSLLWSTMCVAAGEYDYALAARDLGIPTLASILSFDNLTSRGMLARYDRYLVWCERMRDELLQLYPDVVQDDVEITGTPQFDFHRRDDRAWPRERTLAALGLDPGSRYFSYAASHASLTPDEPALVAQLARRMASVPSLEHHWLVVRMHPLDNWNRWSVAASLPRVRLSPSSDETPAPDGWALGSVADQERLVATIRHSDASINVASTASLDAAILDRPVIGIDLRGEPDSPRGILYEEYSAHHYAPLVASGGLDLARSWAELLLLLESAVRDPARGAGRRRAMVERECGIVDGHAAERVAGAVYRAAAGARRQ